MSSIPDLSWKEVEIGKVTCSSTDSKANTFNIEEATEERVIEMKLVFREEYRENVGIWYFA